MEQDLAQHIPFDTVAGDKGYDVGDNHYFLETKGLHSAIRLKKTRIHKKDGDTLIWWQFIATSQYQEGLKERFKIERKFSEANQGYGFGRCRYVGSTRFAIQAFFTAITLNLKRNVKLLTGVGLQNPDFTRCLTWGEVAVMDEKIIERQVL